MLYETKFENRRKTVVNVSEYGRTLVTLQPGGTRHVESRSAKTSYARWTELIFKDKDRVGFTENRAWEWPFPGMLMLEFLNIDGAASEGLRVGNEIYRSDRGIPRLIAVDHRDTTWCFVAKVERLLVEHKIREGDYYIRKKILEDVKTLRSKKEIREIKRQLEAEAVEKAKAEVQYQFQRSGVEASEIGET